jgi:hypothetical protein
MTRAQVPDARRCKGQAQSAWRQTSVLRAAHAASPWKSTCSHSARPRWRCRQAQWIAARGRDGNGSALEVAKEPMSRGQFRSPLRPHHTRPTKPFAMRERPFAPVFGNVPERASRSTTVRSGALGDNAGLRERATTEPAAALHDPIDATRYFTVTVKHSLVRTVPSIPTTRKLTSNSAPSTNRGKAGGPRSTS